jgi:hypothetical protein
MTGMGPPAFPSHGCWASPEGQIFQELRIFYGGNPDLEPRDTWDSVLCKVLELEVLDRSGELDDVISITLSLGHVFPLSPAGSHLARGSRNALSEVDL